MTEGITPPQPPSRPEPADPPPVQTFNERQNVGVRPCAACGGQLEFDIEHQQLTCTHCGSGQAIEHAAGAEVAEQSFRKALAATHGKGDRFQERLDGEKEIICQNCGGHTTFVGTWTATTCPYCATALERTDVHDAPDRLAVDGVLPFQVSEKVATELLEKWINKRWFAPNEFKQYSRAGSFESVYSAYFTFDADAMTDYRGERGENRTRTVRDGNETRTVVETDWYSASGRVFNSFDDITVLGNTGFDARFVNKLEPWPTQRLMQPFNPDYMAGHLSRTYDKDVETCFDEARNKMEPTIDQSIRRDIGGDQQRINQKNTHISNLTYKHVLLPIWLLTVIYAGQPWQVFINGATGEIHGERPWSKVKIAAAVTAVVVLIIVILIARSVAGG